MSPYSLALVAVSFCVDWAMAEGAAHMAVARSVRMSCFIALSF